MSISNYGTQEVLSTDEEEEKDYEAILFGTALHYTLEMLGSFDEESLNTAMIALKNRYGQQLTDSSMEQIDSSYQKFDRAQSIPRDTRWSKGYQRAVS